MMPRRPLVLALALALDASAPAGPPGATPGALGALGAVARWHQVVRLTETTVETGPMADSVVGFRLSDQFGRVHDAAAYRGRAMVLVGAGRGGQAAATAWVQRLRALQDDPAAAVVVPVLAVADLRGVPRLLRRIVRGRFPKERGQAVLLDWEGSVAQRFGFDADECTMLVVGPDGRQHARRTAAAVDTVLARAILREATDLTPSAALPNPPR